MPSTMSMTDEQFQRFLNSITERAPAAGVPAVETAPRDPAAVLVESVADKLAEGAPVHTFTEREWGAARAIFAAHVASKFRGVRR